VLGQTCHVVVQVNDFETAKKAFEKETIGQMNSKELDLGVPQCPRLSAFDAVQVMLQTFCLA
jgi:hypothetical protein